VRLTPARADEPLLGRVIGILFVAGGILGAFSLLLPHPVGADERVLALLDAGAFVVGLLFLAFARALPRWVLHAGIATGSGFICLAIHFSGAAAVYSTMFVWIAAFTGLFLPWRAVVAQLSLLLAGYALALLSITDPAGYSVLTRVLLTGIALAVVAGMTSWLVSRRRLAEQRTQRFFDLSRDMLCTADADGYFVEVNNAWTDTLGYSRAELREKPLITFVHPDDRERTRERLARMFEGREETTFENRYRAKDRSWHWLLWSSSYSPEAGLIFGRATDVTEAKRLTDEREHLVEQLDSMARTDPLTGVPNRRWLADELEREISRARRQRFSLGVAMLDLDHFKRFNDGHGHVAGDELLREATAEWRSVLRAGDFLARYGGEEFVVLRPGCSAAEARALLDRVRSATPRGETCSAGVVFLAPDEDADSVVARADAALYVAKGTGRDRTVVSEDPVGASGRSG
jgi:diguanylate cyclase (GGDEF)-like protein/PAS domain S-box-containing protein